MVNSTIRAGIGSTIGEEVEYLLIGLDGGLVNIADKILKDPRNSGFITKEATLAMVEINSGVASSVAELDEDVRRKSTKLEQICTDHGVLAVPVSEYGAGVAIPRDHPRAPIYEKILGEQCLDEIRKVSGVHLHISQHPEKVLEQYWLLQALDPLSYAITSTSPINHEGINSLNNHRIGLVRDRGFKNFPLHAKVQDYPDSTKSIDLQNTMRFLEWGLICMKEGISIKEYMELFQPDNTGYHAIRKRDGENFGETGTLENRSFDACPLDVSLAAIALYKGCNDYVICNNVEMKIANNYGEYKFGDKKFVLPNLHTLNVMEHQATRYGLKSDMIKGYLTQALRIAEMGLPKEDQIYLAPIRKMLQTRKNPANLIMDHMRSLGYQGHNFNPEQSAQGILFARDMHVRSLEEGVN